MLIAGARRHKENLAIDLLRARPLAAIVLRLIARISLFYRGSIAFQSFPLDLMPFCLLAFYLAMCYAVNKTRREESVECGARELTKHSKVQ